MWQQKKEWTINKWMNLLIKLCWMKCRFKRVLFWPHCKACGILISQPGIEPMAPSVEAQSLNHLATREVPRRILFKKLFHLCKVQEKAEIIYGAKSQNRSTWREILKRKWSKETCTLTEHSEYWLLLLLFSQPVVSNSLWSPGLQHARPSCPSLSPKVCPNSCPSSHLILWCPLILLPSVSPSIRDLSSESVVHIRWPKYRSFSIRPSNEYSGLISLQTV